MWPVIDVALNSAQYNRISLLSAIIENKGRARTSIIEKAMGCSNPTALKEIDTFKILGIVDLETVKNEGPGRPEKEVVLRNDFAWFCSEECDALRKLKPI